MSPHNRLCLSKGGFLETSRFSSSIPLQEFLCPTAHEAHKRSQSFKQYSFLNRLIFLFVSGQEKAGRSVCCVMQSVRVLVMCCGIVLRTLVLEVPSCWS